MVWATIMSMPALRLRSRQRSGGSPTWAGGVWEHLTGTDHRWRGRSGFHHQRLSHEVAHILDCLGHRMPHGQRLGLAADLQATLGIEPQHDTTLAQCGDQRLELILTHWVSSVAGQIPVPRWWPR
jgi:hypothetical protein